jgi:uncharacterized protein (UPF0261 family)
MKTVLLIGTLDTKPQEYAYIREKLKAKGLNTILMDVSLKNFNPSCSADLLPHEMARAAGTEFDAISKLERVPALRMMTEGAIKIARKLLQERKFQGIIALGGSNGTAIGCAIMQHLPLAMPKIMVSTMASGDVRGYVGTKDIIMMNSVADISLNRLTKRILLNAAGSMAGMLRGRQIATEARKIQIGLTVFGVVQPCAERAKELLEEKGYEVMVFHTSGTGGMALEELVQAGEIDAVLDISTTELADEVVGGVLSAGPCRMEAAGEKGIPQVVIPGAIDLVNFKAPDSVPEKWKDRIFYRHTPHITLMRTNVEESAALGEVFAKKLNKTAGPALVLIPLDGFSAYDSPQGPKAINLQGGPAPGPWYWPDADRAFSRKLDENLDRLKVRYEELPLHVNDPGFAERAVAALETMIKKQ